jgi:hypothetical protein
MRTELIDYKNDVQLALSIFKNKEETKNETDIYGWVETNLTFVFFLWMSVSIVPSGNKN